MKPLFGDKFIKDPNAVDMGDMVIANMKKNCSDCEAKQAGCDKKVNTLNCLMFFKRFSKKQEDKREKEEREEVDKEMEVEEKKALADMLKLAMSEAPEEDDDDSNPQISSHNSSQEEDDDDDDED